jgi:tetratricopeptide (TPR) repeat protein
MRFIRLIAPLALTALLSCAGERPAPRVRESVEQVVTHRVESDETWRTLARDYYGDEGRSGVIARDNGMDAGTEPRPGSAVRIVLSERDARRVKLRLDAAREYNAGLDLVSEGNYAAASGRFEEALKLDPALTDASFNLGITYGKLGFHRKAASILRELVSVAPGNVGYRYALGAARFDAGDLAGAEKAFLEVLAAAPSDRKSLFSLAVVLEKRGKSGEAKSRFRQYLALDPDGEWAEAARAHLDAIERSEGGGR